MAPKSKCPAEFSIDGSRTLHNLDDGHSKFYNLELKGASIEARWGAIGSNGQSKTTEYRSASEALDAANKLFREKTNKGYAKIEQDGIVAAAVDGDGEQPIKRAKKGGMEVMLAHAWNGTLPKPCLASEKLDGVRAVWKDGAFWTRNRIEIKVAESIKPATSMCLDGELWGGRGNAAFNRVCGLAHSTHESEQEWSGVNFLAFDAPEVPGPFVERIKAIPKELLLEHKTIASAAEVRECHEEIAKLGGEGLVLRDPAALYTSGRSKGMLKVKEFRDCEATVVGFNWLDSKDPSTSLRCRLDPGDPKTEFSCAISTAMQAEPPGIGTEITVKYFEKTEAGVPRFPSFVGIRGGL